MLTQTAESLISSAPINAPTNDLQSLTVSRPGEEPLVYALALSEQVDKNNAFVKNDDGSILYDLSVTRNGAPMDADAFLVFYRQLLSLRTPRTLPQGTVVTGEAALTLVLVRPGVTRTVCFIPCDPLHDAVAVDGVCRCYVENSWRLSLIVP